MYSNIENILNKIINAFNNIYGIDAIVLGGSYATETADENSDIDIGIYYDKQSFDLKSFKLKASIIDDGNRSDAITDLGEWGPWINGGGWLKIDGISVDILFRDTKKVINVIDECINGIISIDYQCGHPFGFVNSIYLGELAYCKILKSNNNFIVEQKTRLNKFPETYRKAVIDKFLWECEFSQLCGRKAVSKNDIVYAAGSLFRSAVSLIQVLYAINDMYMINEKGSLSRLLKQKNVYIPDGFVNDTEMVFSGLKQGFIEESFDKIQYQYNLILQDYKRMQLID